LQKQKKKKRSENIYSFKEIWKLLHNQLGLDFLWILVDLAKWVWLSSKFVRSISWVLECGVPKWRGIVESACSATMPGFCTCVLDFTSASCVDRKTKKREREREREKNKKIKRNKLKLIF
jgi:hypothetical protein